ALIWLANFSTIEKGRLIEIEVLYVSLFGLALIFWLAWWRERRSGWLTWTVPWIFLGLGLLAKGPLHLLFFYAIVIAVLFYEKKLRQLFGVQHLVGGLIMIVIFAAWALPYWQTMKAANVGQNWSVQLTGRLTGDDFKLGSWLLNIPRGLAYFLPWTLLLPLVWKTRWTSDSDRHRGEHPVVPVCGCDRADLAAALESEADRRANRPARARVRIALRNRSGLSAGPILCATAFDLREPPRRSTNNRPVSAGPAGTR